MKQDAYPIILYIFQQVFGTIGIQVVPKHCAPLLGCRNGERSYSCKHIGNDIFRLELFDKPFMLGM